MAKPASLPAQTAVSQPAESPTGGGSATDGAFVILDLVHLTRQTFGDAALEHEVLTLFADQAMATTASLRSASSDDERRRLFHLLKGSARGVGAFRLAEAAWEGEQNPASPSVLDQVCHEADRVGDRIAALLMPATA